MSFVKRNDALNLNNHDGINGGPADIAITTPGSSFYFAVSAIMFAATIAFLAVAVKKHRSHRIFHYITAAITLVAGIAYFTMGADLGRTPIGVEFLRSDGRVSGFTREIFYVRYIDWVITTPLLLLDLLLTAGMPKPTILFVLLVDEIMIICGLIGALVASRYKWAYFTFACVALFYILYVLLIEARRHVTNLDTKNANQGSVKTQGGVKKVFRNCGILTAFLWTMYPIAWGVSEGGNVISPVGEAIFYGILDVLAKVGFGALLLHGHRNISPSDLGLHIHDYEEKDHVGAGKGHTGLTNSGEAGLSSSVAPSNVETTSHANAPHGSTTLDNPAHGTTTLNNNTAQQPHSTLFHPNPPNTVAGTQVVGGAQHTV